MKKISLVMLSLIVALSLTGCGQTDPSKSEGKSSVVPAVEKPKPETTATQPASGLTAQEVAKHNSATSCYIVVSGGVYDVTSYIDKHPGGPDKVLALCGQDGTSAFTNQHGGQPRPEATLANYKIGDLVK